MLYFEAFAQGIKWLIIAIFSYYEPYNRSAQNARIPSSLINFTHQSS
jgi:hypothetical protein